MTERSFRVGDLKRIIAESSNEFKPVLGQNVESDNKKNNDKSYKDAEKATKEYDNVGQKKNAKYEKVDANRTVLDYNPVNDPGKEYKERVKAQAKGYNSKLEQDNKIEKAAEFDSNEDFIKAIKASSDDVLSAKKQIAHSGLQARMLPEPEYNKLVSEGSKPMPKKLTFKHSKFICESQVLSRVPDTYKVDGQVIHMADNYGNVFVVECKLNLKTHIVESEVVSHSNKQMMNEQVDRIKSLFDYTSPNSRSIKANALNENKEFQTILNTCNTK